jgi:hypothetical protein
MSVRIVENFWDNFFNNEVLIRKCFFHHYNRHPDPENLDGSYNNLIIKLHEYNVFGRFDLKKLMVAAGLSVAFIQSDMEAEAELDGAGVNLSKKWEQFIYKWIEKIINEEYNKNGKRSKRFLHGEKLVDYGVPQEERTSWIQNSEEATMYEERFVKYTDDRRGRKFPPSFSNRYVAGEEEFDSPLEALEATDTRKAILDRLKGKNDESVFNLLEQGLTEKDIAGKLGFTQQYVGPIIRKIRGITKQICAA